MLCRNSRLPRTSSCMVFCRVMSVLTEMNCSGTPSPSRKGTMVVETQYRLS